MLPEYDENPSGLSSGVWMRPELLTDKEIGDIIHKISEFVQFFEDEESQLIYDGENIFHFAIPLNVIPECYPSRERQLRFTLKGLENWRHNRLSSSCEEWHYYFNIINNEIRSELASRSIRHPDSSYVIAACIPQYQAKSWNLSKDGTNVNIESYPLDIKVLFDWQSRHHKPRREYHWNEKHGEYGKGAHPENKGDKVDVLLGSREEAKIVLQNAIGSNGYDVLHAYDAKYAKYMEFKAELKAANMNGSESERYYHSYHLSDDSTIDPKIKNKLSHL